MISRRDFWLQKAWAITHLTVFDSGDSLVALLGGSGRTPRRLSPWRLSFSLLELRRGF